MFKSSRPLSIASLDSHQRRSHQRRDRRLEGVELSNLSSLSATNDDDDWTTDGERGS